MYVPKNLAMESDQQVYEFINEFGFGILVSNSLTGSHLPFNLLQDEAGQATLYTHCARANSQWQDLAGQEVLVIFSGPHGYISPTWYNKSPAVPTWNYSAVHAYGQVALLDEQQTLSVVEQTVEKYEPSLFENPNVFDKAFNQKLSKAIVGLKITLNRVEGKHKLGQHRSDEDQLGTLHGLLNSNNLSDKSLAEYMQKQQLGNGKSV